jgi:hypothetical protein
MNAPLIRGVAEGRGVLFFYARLNPPLAHLPNELAPPLSGGRQKQIA